MALLFHVPANERPDRGRAPVRRRMPMKALPPQAPRPSASQNRCAVLLAALWCLLCQGLKAAPGDAPSLPPASQSKVDFVRDIQPVIAKNCYPCHGPDQQKGGLRWDSKEIALKGGRSGPVIVPGDSASSRVIRMVAGLEEDMVMPKKGDRLTAAQIGLLRAWIDQGASWPEGADPKLEASELFWSLKPPVRVNPPPIKHHDLAEGVIDQFIEARLEKDGLALSPPAGRRALIRRMSLDLTGLPPAPEEVQSFIEDKDPRAVEKLADRLLASPRYGERWARHWLDVVRFAESHGYEMNQPRPNAWPYRDYVIRSFNEDKPYDRFVLEQLAGDTLGADEATGFLVGGPDDQVKSPDEQLTKQQRADELHDMVSTTGSAFLGLTVGCARCHNHKFDPISQKDYYSMQAVFAGVNHADRAWRRPGGEKRREERETAQNSLQALERELERFEPVASLAQTEGGEIQPHRPAVNARRDVDRFAPIRARWLRFTIEATTGDEPCLDEIEVYTHENPARNVALASAGAKVSASGTLPNFDIHKLEHLNDGRYGNSRSWISNEKGRGWVQIEFEQPCEIHRVVWGRDREGKFTDRLASRYRIEVAEDTNRWTTVATSVDRRPYRAEPNPGEGYTADGMAPPEAAKLRELLERKRGLQTRLAELSVEPMVYAGKFENPPPSYKLYRGDPMQPREQVSPGGISEIQPVFQLSTNAPESERRLSLARWICDPRNPLTARVIVNRLWHYHFGKGIVNTPSDFGQMGDRPSHPELLDWLACELVANGWHLKPIQRLIVLSRAYRQSSDQNLQAMRLDAGDRFLWRFAPQRLEAEEIRDAILATSGKLDLRPGGPGFDVFEPNSNYVRVYTAKEDYGPAEWRRMVYQFKPRMQQDGVFGAFDCPDGAQITPRRNNSITPLQALNLLNSNFILQQCRFLAQRLEHETGASVDAQVARAYALAFGRPPSAGEAAAAAAFIQREGLTAFCRALFNANEFIFVY